MSTLWKYSYYVYLIIAAILFFEGVTRLSSDSKWAFILIALSALVVVKFFVTRRLRRSLEKRNQQK